MNPAPSTNSPSSRNGKKRRRAAKTTAMRASNMPVITSPNLPFVSQFAQQAGVSTQGRGTATMNKIRPGKLTPEGTRFLKCAFAAADFDGSSLLGVPDRFAGKSVAVKHRKVVAGQIVANTDYYILVAPVPGYAYFVLSKAAGVAPVATDQWVGVQYADFNSLFVSSGVQGTSGYICQKFRYVSQHFELVNTNNANSWSGSIQVWKIPVQTGVEQVNGADKQTIMGLTGTLGDNADMYSGPFNLGAFAGAFNKGSSDWAFTPIWNAVSQIPETPALIGDFGTLSATAGSVLPGFDNNFETVLVKISGVLTSQSALFRSWACVEYQFSPGSLMYEMQSLKCMEDEVALDLYRRIVMELPTAVSCLDNANFWTRVLGIIKSISGGLAILPGPYGMAAGGVNTIARAVEEFTL